MAIANSEWWNRAAIPEQPEISIQNKFKQTVELMAVIVSQAIDQLTNPPYPTPDGKPLRIVFYDGPNSLKLFPAEQMEQLNAIAKIFQR